MKKLIAIAGIALLLGTSCKKDIIDQGYGNGAETAGTNNSKAQKTDELVVSDKFDWKTTGETKLVLTGYANAPVLITTQNGTVLEKAMLKTNESYTTIISVPLAEKAVVLHYMGQQINLDLNQAELVYSFN